MKIKKLGLLALAMGLGLSLAACDDDKKQDKPNDDNPGTVTPENPNNPGTVTPENPNNPGTVTPDKVGKVSNVSYNKETSTITWDKADKATGYIVNVNGTIFNSTTTSLKLEESFVAIHGGCHIDIKVSAVNNEAQSDYSDKLSVLVGEDSIKDEDFENFFSQGGVWSLQTAKEVMEKHNISKTEFLAFSESIGMQSFASGVLSKEKMAILVAYNYKLVLTANYSLINPNYVEGQDKKLVQYLDNNFDKVVNALEVIASINNLTGNVAIMEAMGRLQEIPAGTIELNDLLNLYTNIQIQLNEAVPNAKDVEKLIATAKEVLDIVLEENTTLAMQIHGSLFPKEELGEALTEQQLANLKAEVATLLGNVENLLSSTLELTKALYSNISNASLEKIVNLKTKVEENSKYLINESLEEQFMSQYAASIISSALIDELKTDAALNSIMDIVDELKVVTKNENVAQLIATLFPIEQLPEGVTLAAIINQCLTLVSKEEISSLLTTVSLVSAPMTDAKYIAALTFTQNQGSLYGETYNDYYSGKITEEELDLKIEQIDTLGESATKDIAVISYGALREVLITLSDEELALVASMLEGVVIQQVNQSWDQQIAYIQEEIEYYEQQKETVGNEYLADLDKQIETAQNTIKWYQDRETEDHSYQVQIEDWTNQLNSLLEQKENALQAIEDNKAYYQGKIDSLEEEINKINDYTEQYFNLLKDLKAFTTNLEKEELEDAFDNAMGEMTDAKLINLLKIIVENNTIESEDEEATGIIEDIFTNAKVIYSDEKLEALGIDAMLEQFEQVFELIKVVSTYDAENLTPEQQENLDLLKSMFQPDEPGVDVKVILSLENVLGTWQSNFGETYTISETTVFDGEFTYNIVAFEDNVLYAEDPEWPDVPMVLSFSVVDDNIIFVNQNNDEFTRVELGGSLVPPTWEEGTYINVDSGGIFITIQNGKLIIETLEDAVEVVIGNYDEESNTLSFKEGSQENSITMNEDGTLTYNGVVYQLRRS